MSRTKVYKCDFCGQIKAADEIIGFSGQLDAFDPSKSYGTIRADQAVFHHCTECADMHVVRKAETLSPRFKGEREWLLKFNELYYLFKSKCISSLREKKKCSTK